MKKRTFKRIVYGGKIRFRICPRCQGTGTFLSGETCYYVSAKYCYVTRKLRLHQNDRCKRFTPV